MSKKSRKQRERKRVVTKQVKQYMLDNKLY